MVSVLEILNSRLPFFKFFEEKFKEKYGIEKFTSHWNETYYVYIFVMSLVHISLLVYTFYLLYTCLRVKRVQGSGTTYVNGFCDVLFACFCMPCYIVYRGFLNPCKVLQEVKVVKEFHTVPTATPGYQPIMTQPMVGQQPAQLPAQQPMIVQQPGGPTTILPSTSAIGKTTSTKVVGGGKKKGKNNKILKSNKVLI